MNIEECFDAMKDIQHKILLFVEKSENEEENYQNLVTLFDNHKIRDDQCKLKSLLTLISKISENHYRSNNFFSKIEKILLFFNDDIKKSFSNYEIFFIFKENKKILLFLIKYDLLTIDQPIALIMQKSDFESKKYPQFFFPEMKNFLKEKKIEEISKEIPENFEDLRSKGENENEICEIIRNDSIDEFIAFSEKTNLPLDSKICQSIFETNSFLMRNSCSVIEYAAFFGSIKIIKHLVKNNVKLDLSLWIYAIHSNNIELIQFLEENKIKPRDFQSCFEESIKCFHNAVTVFIQSNYLLYLTITPIDIFRKSLKFHNYDFLRYDFINASSIFDLCEYDHPDIFKILLETAKIDVNKIAIYIICLIQFLF